MFGAIFSSSKEDYECEVSRLMKRAAKLTSLYIGKAGMLSRRASCSVDTGKLQNFYSMLNSFSSSLDLLTLENYVEELKTQNELNYDCRLW